MDERSPTKWDTYSVCNTFSTPAGLDQRDATRVIASKMVIIRAIRLPNQQRTGVVPKRGIAARMYL